jgi:RNA polymerase sigma-70 factor, ECF subfamily
MPRDPLEHPERMIRQVYAYVAYRIGGGPDAEDVTSEVFERALRYRKSYDPAKGAPSTWLFGIARRCVAEQAARAPATLSEALHEADSHDLEQETVRRIELGEAVATLSESDQELLALRYGADLTARQIAEIVGARTNAVEVSLHRALARLRAHLSEEAPRERRAPSADSRASDAGSF